MMMGSRRGLQPPGLSKHFIQTHGTFADMLASLAPEMACILVVTADEYQDSEHVMYIWTGQILLDRGLTPCGIQPQFDVL